MVSHTAIEDMRLIVVSVVSDRTGEPYGFVQAWSLDTLEDNLRRQRREWDKIGRSFLPVAAFLADPAMLMEKTGLNFLPTSAWPSWTGRWFCHGRMIVEAEGPIYRHIASLDDGGAYLFAAWELWAGLQDVG